MRIAFVTFAFGEYSIRLTSSLADHVEVGLWITDSQAQPYTDRLDDRVQLHPFAKPRMRQPMRQVGVMQQIFRQLRRYDPDLIHIQQGYLWMNPFLGLLRRYPLVVTVHDPEPHFGDRLGKKTPQFIADMAYRRAAAIIVHTPEVKRALHDRIDLAVETHVIPHLALGEPMPLSAKPSSNDVLFFGRIWPYKGLEYLIKAEPLISAQVPDVRIVIAGTGEDLDRYRAMMINPDRFEVINEFVSPSQTAELFTTAGLVALPYVDATQSGVIPMSYHYSTPVVATRVGGLPSQVEHGKTGFIVPPRDERALADAIVRLLQSTTQRESFGNAARAKALTELSAPEIAAQTANVYAETLRRRN